MEFIKKIKRFSIVTMIFGFLAGILLIAFPAESMMYISIGIGVFLMCIGVFAAISYLRGNASTFSLVSGIILIICGIIIAIKYKALATAFIVILGIFIVSAGITNLIAGLKIVYERIVLGWTTLFLSVATIVFGVIAIVNASSLSETLTRLIGIGLIIYAILDLIVYLQVRSAVKKASEEAKLLGDVDTDATVISVEDEVTETETVNGDDIVTEATVISVEDEETE